MSRRKNTKKDSKKGVDSSIKVTVKKWERGRLEPLEKKYKLPRKGQNFRYEFSLPEGNAHLDLRKTTEGFLIDWFNAYPKGIGIGRKVLRYLRRTLTPRPLKCPTVYIEAKEFWDKMVSEGLIEGYDSITS